MCCYSTPVADITNGWPTEPSLDLWILLNSAPCELTPGDWGSLSATLRLDTELFTDGTCFFFFFFFFYLNNASAWYSVEQIVGARCLTFIELIWILAATVPFNTFVTVPELSGMNFSHLLQEPKKRRCWNSRIRWINGLLVCTFGVDLCILDHFLYAFPNLARSGCNLLVP